MEPKSTIPSIDPTKGKKKNPSRNEEMDAPNSIGEIEEEGSLTPKNEEAIDKQSEEIKNSSAQNKEMNETLGLDDDDLETKEESVVN